jgi:hypothetical protein
LLTGAEAVQASQELVTLRRELAALDRDANLPGLANSLHSLAVLLVEAGQRAEAVQAVEEAVMLRKELADLNRDAFLPELVHSIGVLGLVMLENDRVADSVAACLTAMWLGADLPEHSQVGIDVAVVTLRRAYRRDPRQAEATYQEYRGREFPDYLK